MPDEINLYDMDEVDEPQRTIVSGPVVSMPIASPENPMTQQDRALGNRVLNRDDLIVSRNCNVVVMEVGTTNRVHADITYVDLRWDEDGRFGSNGNMHVAVTRNGHIFKPGEFFIIEASARLSDGTSRIIYMETVKIMGANMSMDADEEETSLLTQYVNWVAERPKTKPKSSNSSD